MRNAELNATKIRDIMSKDLKTASPNDTMQQVERQLIDHKINHVPVINTEGELLGIITKNDIELLKDWGTELSLPSAQHMNRQLLSSQLASDRMSEVIITVSPEHTLKDCADIFLENIFHALPVLENNKLVGIITTYDLIKHAYV